MTSLKERIETEMNAQTKADLLRLNARIEKTKEIVELIKGTFTQRPAMLEVDDVVGVIQEHGDHDIADRAALLAGVEDQRVADDDGLDRLLDDIVADRIADRFDAADDLSQESSPSSLPPRDPEDGSYFDSDFHVLNV
jgi:hypothetical protein